MLIEKMFLTKKKNSPSIVSHILFEFPWDNVNCYQMVMTVSRGLYIHSFYKEQENRIILFLTLIFMVFLII